MVSSFAKSRARVETISDGIFAIALTLLVLSINFDQAPHQTFGEAFRDAIPQIWAYALSFAVITLFWIGHHRFFMTLRTADHRLVVLNFVYLGIIAFIPFPTEVLGDHGDEPGAAVLYAATLAIAMLATCAMTVYALRADLYEPNYRRRTAERAITRNLITAGVFATSIPFALWLGSAQAEWWWLLLVPLGIFFRRRWHEDPDDEVADDPTA
jgi:uncharacterized membrane protein